MARRDRTTGLPGPRRKESDSSGPARGRFGLTEFQQRWAILGGVIALLVLVLGIFGYRWYDENYQRPNKVILSVGQEDYKLRYYSDRLLPFLQQNQGTNLAIAEQALLNKLEEEGLTLALAEERGIEVTRDDVNNFIADDLGVEYGGSGTAFDNLYRQRLSTLDISDSNYRRLSEAAFADAAIRLELTDAIGGTGETVQLRIVVLPDEDAASEVLSRVEGGEDMGSIAQTDSLDLDTRQTDGILTTAPTLLPDDIATAIEGIADGELLGPIEDTDEGNFWVVRVEGRDDDGELSEEQVTQLVALQFDDLIDDVRSRTEIDRDLSTDDIEWAEDHAG